MPKTKPRISATPSAYREAIQKVVARHGKSRDRRGRPTTAILRYEGEEIEAERRLNHRGQTETWLGRYDGQVYVPVFHEVGSRVRTFEPDPTVGERLFELVINK